METRLATLIDKGIGAASPVGPLTPLHVALEVMVRSGAGAVGVFDGTKVVGILTERDVLRRVVRVGKDPSSVPVHQVMSAPAHVADAQLTVREALQKMCAHDVRRLPVVSDGRFVGILSLRALSSWLARDLEHEVNELSVYICGRASVPPASPELEWAMAERLRDPTTPRSVG